MKTKLFTLATSMLLLLFNTNANAQRYCFWVANQSTETFNELKIRIAGSGDAFGNDLLPSDLIKPGQHFWVKTVDNGQEMWDIQITRANGTALLFTYTDRGGTKHIDQRFITINARLLHTLVIQEDADGNLAFAYYTNDQLDYGDPCTN
jgi:hypothetical protein